jgi:3-oxoacyl-[acyl-carrier-protein] synthase I
MSRGQMRPVLLSARTMTSCLGVGLAPTRTAFRTAASGLAPCRFETVALDTFVGEIPGVDAVRIPAALARFDCRNNRAAELGLSQDGFPDAVAAAARRHGAQRVGVFIGTSTAGILQTELAYRRRDPADGSLPADFDYRRTHNTFSVAEYVRERLGLQGPCAAISTACSSSAKAFASAARLMDAGLVDAAVVGGVDTFCLTTLYGFNSLQLLSARPCRPYDVARDGISIGEAAAFFLLERRPEHPPRDAIGLLGAGETSDAHHMSAPHPEGLGARRAMEAALASAGLERADIDYVNLHGTGTPSNDAAEDIAVHGLFGDSVPVNSTKGMTGHTLGAAGAVEALIAVLAIEEGRVPGSAGTRDLDPVLRARYEVAGHARDVSRVVSNSFGFGGSNCSLVFGRMA